MEVHFDFDLNGILTVTATEKGKGQQGSLVVSNTGTHRLSSHELKQARAELDALFESDETIDVASVAVEPVATMEPKLAALVERAQQFLETLDAERAEELQDLLAQIEEVNSRGDAAELAQQQEELEDFLYYANS